jgi:hypothetical protein
VATNDNIRTLQFHGAQYLLSRCLHCAVELGIADHLGELPESIEVLSSKVGANPNALARLLRYLAAVGIFENLDGCFGHSAQSRLLRVDHPHSQHAWMRLLGSDLSWEVARSLGHSIRTGRPATETFGAGSIFGYLSAHPQDAEIFNHAMTSKALADIASVLRAYDFSGSRTLADIGGGRGHLLRAVLDATPSVTGTLFDLPDVLMHAPIVASERLSLHGGDFFRDVLPVCDTYLLMNVIHDWGDADATSILRAVRSSAPAHAKLLLLEILLPQSPRLGSFQDLYSLDIDVAMLAFTGGRERTRRDYDALLAAADFRLIRVIETDCGLAILESVPGMSPA